MGTKLIVPALIMENKFVCMQKSFVNVEDVLDDDMFLSWFYQESDEKVKNWQNWLVENPGYQSLVAEAINVLTALNVHESPVTSFQQEAAYSKLSTKLDELEKEAAPVLQMRSTKRPWFMGAAAAILILVTGLAFFKFSPSKAIIKTQYGQLSQQKLPDGSEVMLNANTIVTLSNDWKEGNDREVWLKGEAFFHVKKTPHKNRFIVHTDQLDVIVTGTQFNVVSRGDKTSVLLTEGSVTIKTKDGKEIFMKPGDFVEMQNDIAEKKVTNQDNVLAWKENKMNFDNAPMKEVAGTISNYYGVTIKFADKSIGEVPVTGILPNNNLDDLLKALEVAYDLHITKNGKEVLISKQ